MSSLLRFTIFFTLVVLLACPRPARAHNISISKGPFFEKIATNPGEAYIWFGVTWERSWRHKHAGPLNVTNWDAAWCFTKFQVNNRGPWKHAYISPDVHHHYVTSSANVRVRIQVGLTNGKGMGVFLYRDTIGHGTFRAPDVKLRWNYAVEGIEDTDTINFRTFAIEMVYIPEGAFTLGDGSTAYANFFWNASGNLSSSVTQTGALQRQVTNEAAFNFVPTVAPTTTITIPATYPKGFAAFYVMKHEITQHAYVDFLNSLNPAQQNARTFASPTAAIGTFAMNPTNTQVFAERHRNFIRIRYPASSTAATGSSAVYGHSINQSSWRRDDNGGNIAANFLSIYDGLAYADFAGLRPMTELEFEKACRGPEKPFTGEYAWGSPWFGASVLADSITEVFTGREYIARKNVNARPMTLEAPIRVGAFANDSSYRDDAGATLYGIMNMSDNVWERVINIRAIWFDGQHGDGEIGADGEHNVPNWPMWTGVATTAANYRTGWVLRGNQISNRVNTESTTVTPETTSNARPAAMGAHGFRAVRTAPEHPGIAN